MNEGSSLGARELKSRTNVGQCDHQGQWFAWARVKTKRQIEVPGVFRNGVQDDAANTDDIGGLRDALRGVTKKGAAHALPLFVAVDRQPREYGDRDRIGYIPSKAAGSSIHCYDTGSQGIIADYLICLAEDVSARRAGDLIGPRPFSEPFVERGFAGAKISGIVPVGKELGR